MAKNDDFFQNFSKIEKIINFAEILKKSSFFAKILKKSSFLNVIFVILNGLVRFFSTVVYCCLLLQHCHILLYSQCRLYCRNTVTTLEGLIRTPPKRLKFEPVRAVTGRTQA